ncbi:MAG: hypothetical protein NTZ95_03585 [Candidatus Omnitrophica bacterium]|nr:hypothetical protein [Candidatus Omnitrophota bacterium]
MKIIFVAVMGILLVYPAYAYENRAENDYVNNDEISIVKDKNNSTSRNGMIKEDEADKEKEAKHEAIKKMLKEDFDESDATPERSGTSF